MMDRTVISPEKKAPSYNVLLVEEESQQIEFYTELIREVHECKIDVLSRMEDFLEWVDRSTYHLVVIDGSISGLTLLEQLKRVSPTTSAILISDKASIEEAVAAIRLGAEDYLSKPFKIDAFQLAVKRGLDRKAVFGDDTGAANFLHLLNSCQLISASLEKKKIFEIVQSYFLHELNAGYCAVYTLDEKDLVRVSTFETTEQHDLTLIEVLDISLRASNSIQGISNSNEFFRFVEQGQLTPSLFIFRFKCSGPSDYFCVCLSPGRPAALDSFESRLRLLRAQIEVTGKNIEQYLGVQQLVYVDDVTGLYNTRYLNYILEREIHHTQLTGKPFAILFIDADRFKAINDTHGHWVGTAILNELGNHLKSYIREKDTIFRYGGDEFVAVLSSCDLKTAQEVAERIRDSVEKKSFMTKNNMDLRFTISIGVALFPEHAKTRKEIMEAADHAMYNAKRSTRNKVSVATVGAEISGEHRLESEPKKND